MKKIIKWTAVFAVMFCVSTLLSMWSGNDVSWAAFAGGEWDVGALFAPLLTAACWAVWPTPTYSPLDELQSQSSTNDGNWMWEEFVEPFNQHLITNIHYQQIVDDDWMDFVDEE